MKLLVFGHMKTIMMSLLINAYVHIKHIEWEWFLHENVKGPNSINYS